MLCTWARDYGVIGTGIDMSQLFTEQARLRAEELGVADQVKFIHGDAAGFVSDEKAGVAACLGATSIAGGVAGTVELLAQSLRPGGIVLIGEPFWRQIPPTEDVARGSESRLDLRLSPASSTSRVFRPPRLRRRGNGFGRPGQLGQIRGRQVGSPCADGLKPIPRTSSRRCSSRLASKPERYAAYSHDTWAGHCCALMTRE